MYKILRAKNQSGKKRVLEFARQLVSLPSPTFQEGQVAEQVEREMRRIGYDRVFRDETGNVVGAMLGREEGPTVLLTCHLDAAARPEEPEGRRRRERSTRAVCTGRERRTARAAWRPRCLWAICSSAVRCRAAGI